MSQNIHQVFVANPITTNAATDLMYFGQSPYGAGNDAAMTYANFNAQIVVTGTLNALGYYATAGNKISPLITANSAVLVTSATGVPGYSATMTNGQLIIGTTSGTPSAATLSAGTGITITNAAGSITISASGGAGWIDEASGSVAMTVNTGYTCDDGATLITFTLPITSAIGDFIEINGKASGLYTIAQAAGQQIHFGNLASTLGATGTVSSTLQYDCIRLRCITANTIWVVVSSIGNFTVV